ncbi:LOW QUALITY PROTEIN: hypothetical protein PHMEG_0006246 [Phytophthora megakarya]|uniref:Reverse transcriptase domain-containing protein n=1 Tax=Phytophthora megakarya TaxID=4795 RepID=A0A225WPF5_9STRA|nr:LOW QUALITY PROTEIN: hypothetical protein PHMEG_0006246 [Phytophthora megakarya]
MYDVWGVVLSDDPPAKVPSLAIWLKEGAQSYKCKLRKYSPQLRQFLREFNAQLVELESKKSMGLSCSSCKTTDAGSDFRQTTDYRLVNNLTETMTTVMPILPVILENAKGKKHFGLFYLLKGFWHLPLADASQEILSFMTDAKIFTPRRVPQGCSDTAIHFQQAMEKCFEVLHYKHLLFWIDDMLLFTDDIESYMEKMQELFTLIYKFAQCKNVILYKPSVKWCKTIINSSDITHDPSRMEGLLSVPEPGTAGELQLFICAPNWMRESLIYYARTIAPLQALLDNFLDIQLSAAKRSAFQSVKDLLASSATLAFPDDTAFTCLFTDVSDCNYHSAAELASNDGRHRITASIINLPKWHIHGFGAQLECDRERGFP